MNESHETRDRTPDPRDVETENGDGRVGPPADDRWAPWWVYLVPILAANLIRGRLMEGRDLEPVVQVTAALGLAAVLFGVITLVWRTTRRSDPR